MADILTISKTESSFPDYLSWANLRKVGIKHIENLGSDLWTDYNVHDPGITILEVLCFALTDLGYRTNFDIKDLLTLSDAQKDEQIKEHGEVRERNFFSAAEILSCNPVTITDLRKLLMDIKGVRNAWLEPAEKGETDVYLNGETRKLQYEKPIDEQGNCELKIRGLYNVCIEPEPVFTTDPCDRSFFSTEDIIDEVNKVLNAHRNLCEDFGEVILFGEEEIGICADIELTSDADADDVLLEIYLKIEEFLSPTPRYYTLQEMLDKGKKVEEIFEGRPLNLQSHGFIDPDDLEKMEPREKLYASDLIEIIMDVPGVRAVHKFVFGNNINDLRQTTGERWCIKLNPKYRPHLILESSANNDASQKENKYCDDNFGKITKGKKYNTNITFYKGSLRFNANRAKVNQRFDEERIARTKVKQEPYNLDLSIPEGNYRELDEYYSIQEDFPITYGIGSEKLKGTPDKFRQAQAKQLKSYLLFYDQILANYLAQLANVRNLFSFYSQNKEDQHTYFVHLLKEVPGIEELIRNYHACQNGDPSQPNPDTYPGHLMGIVENLETYQNRRNRFLDHLLARFSESFTEYVLLTFKIEGEGAVRQDLSKIIQDKEDFLQHYPEISRNRGKAYNYRPVPTPPKEVEDELWDTEENISGLERRVSKLLGIDNVGRYSMAHTEVSEVNEGWTYIVNREKEVDEGEENTRMVTELWLQSEKIYDKRSEAEEGLNKFKKLGAQEANYRRVDWVHDNKITYSFLIVDDDNQPFVRCEIAYESESDRDLAMTKLRAELIAPGLNCSIEAADECFYFCLLPPKRELYNGETGDLPSGPLLRSNSGYKTAKDAEDAFKQFLKRAANIENYKLTSSSSTPPVDTGEPETGEETGLTGETSTGEYDSTGETGEFDLTGDTFGDVDTEDSNEVSPDCEDSTGETGGTGGTGEAYGFCLLDENGKILAIDPVNTGEGCLGELVESQTYDTAQERDDRLQAIIYYLNKKQPEFEADGEPGQYGFEVLDGYNSSLFKSVRTYKTEAAARADFHLLQELARCLDFFRPTGDQTGDEPYSFEIWDRHEEVLAYHPRGYATEMERDLVIDYIFYTSFNQTVLPHIYWDESHYYYQLRDPNGKVLMESSVGYPHEPGARKAWQEFMAFAGSRAYYEFSESDETPIEHTFALRNGEGTIIARHSEGYFYEEERDMALKCVVQYVCHTSFRVDITGIPGIFHFLLLGENDRELLRSYETYPDRETAYRAFYSFLTYGKDPDLYFRNTDGFEIRDEQGQILAVNSDFYPDESALEATIEMILNYLREDAIQHEVVNTEGVYRVQVLDQEEKVALQGVEIFYSREAAGVGLNEIFKYAAKFDNYQKEDEGIGPCPYRFYLIGESGITLAESPENYADPASRDEAMVQVYIYLTKGEDLVEDVVREEYAYYYEWKDEEGKVLLKSENSYSDEQEALAAFKESLQWAGQLDNYRLFDSTSGFSFELVDQDDNRQAFHPHNYESEEDREEVILDMIRKVKMNGLGYRFEEWSEEVQFFITDRENKDFLAGTKVYPDREIASEQLLLAYQQAASKANYRLVNHINTCQFGFELLDPEEQPLAKYPTFFASAEERDEAITQFIHYLQGLELMPFFVPVISHYKLAVLDFSGVVLFEIDKTFVTKEIAENYFTGIFLPLATQEENYKNKLIYKESGDGYDCYYNIQLFDEADLIFHKEYSSKKERDKVFDTILRLLREEEVSHRLEGTDCGYYFYFDYDRDTRIKSKRRYPTELLARQACMETGANLQNTGGCNICFEDGGFYVRLINIGDEVLAQSEPMTEEKAHEICDYLTDRKEDDLLTGFKFYQRGYTCQLKDGDLIRLQSVNRKSYVVYAALPKNLWFSNTDDRDKAIEEVINCFGQEGTGREPLFEEEDDYWTIILQGEENTIELHSPYPINYENKEEITAKERKERKEQIIKEAQDPDNYVFHQDASGCCYWFEIIDKSGREQALENACEGCRSLLEQGQKESNYRKVTIRDDCYFMYELLSEGKKVIARPPEIAERKTGVFYTRESRGEDLSTIMDLINREGMHLVEHVLLRPRNPGYTPTYQFEVQDGEECLFRSVFSYPSRTSAENALKKVIEIYKTFDCDNFMNLDDLMNFEIIRLSEKKTEKDLDTGEELLYTYQILDTTEGESNLLAYVEGCFKGTDEVLKDIDSIKHLLISLTEPETGMTGSGETGETGLTIEQIIQNAISMTPHVANDLNQDQLLSPVGDCGSGEEPLCSSASDPYSFRASVILPYWPARFQEPEFRSYIETTLRKEAPAHVFLRICWISPCQMNEFEKAYRQWMESLALGTDSCDYTLALNALIDILFKLRNVYPKVKLLPCEGDEGSKSPFILNQTVLGNANSTNNDNA